MRRREFVELTASVVGAAALTGCAAFVATPVTPVNGEITLPLRNYPQLEQPGGFLRLRPAGSGAMIYVVAAGPGRYAALSSVCTHLQCTVNVEGSQIRCPCHGSTFDREGNVLQGPATQPLARYATRVTAEGDLVIRYLEAP
jgi:cytochrome b6-f complex iron-sulfur subunit